MWMRSLSMRRGVHALLGACGGIVVVACASAPPRDGLAVSSSRDVISRPVPSNARIITGEELARPELTNALEAVTRLHPEFLRPSNRALTIARPELALYVDGEYISGDISQLSLFSVSGIKEIRFLHPAEAHFRFGAACRCSGGALVVTTREIRSPDATF